jgi:hypothetical protein
MKHEKGSPEERLMGAFEDIAFLEGARKRPN